VFVLLPFVVRRAHQAAEDGYHAVLIPIVDLGVERLLRAELPLGEDVGDVSFDAPSGTWSAQLARITINVFLFAVSRSAQPARPTPDRILDDGRRERRPALPMVELSYLVSVYAGSTRDEHQLLSDVFTCFVTHPILPADHLTQPLDSAVQLQLAPHDHARIKDIWGGVGGNYRPSFELVATAALDSLPWLPLPPMVDRIDTNISRVVGSGTG
jgi:hypothetical protein